MVELRDDPEELKKVLEYFEKNKPNIAAPIEFKKSLRSKLDNIIALKLGKMEWWDEKGFGYFIASVLTFCFILFGIFIFHENINVFYKGFSGPDVTPYKGGVNKGPEVTCTGSLKSRGIVNDTESVEIEASVEDAFVEEKGKDSFNIIRIESFDDFCVKNSGEIIRITNNGRSCRINGQECFENYYYLHGACNFTPIN